MPTDHVQGPSSASGPRVRRAGKRQVITVGVTDDDFVDSVFLRFGIFHLHALALEAPDEGAHVVEPEA